MVVMDARPGSADDLWLCSWATELAAGAPAGQFLCLVTPQVSFPTSSAVGWDDTLSDALPICKHTPLREVRIFLRFIMAHRALRAQAMHTQTPS